MNKPEDKENSGNFPTFIKAESIDLKELEIKGKIFCDFCFHGDCDNKNHRYVIQANHVKQLLADKYNRLEKDINNIMLEPQKRTKIFDELTEEEKSMVITCGTIKQIIRKEFTDKDRKQFAEEIGDLSCHKAPNVCQCCLELNEKLQKEAEK